MQRRIEIASQIVLVLILDNRKQPKTTGTMLKARVVGHPCANTHTHIQAYREGVTSTRPQQTSSHSRKTQRSSETIVSCGGPEPGDRERGTWPEKAKEGRRSARNTKRVIDAMWKTGETYYAVQAKPVDKGALVHDE